MSTVLKPYLPSWKVVLVGKTEVIYIHAVAATDIFHACTFVSGLSYKKWVASPHDFFFNVAFM